MTLRALILREISELRLAARIAAGFGLMENATILSRKAADLEASLHPSTLIPQPSHHP